MEISQEELSSLYQTFKKVSVYDFSNYSQKSFYRRIEKILTDNNLTISTLIDNLNKDYDFLESIVNQITVNTTELFRDPDIWLSAQKLIEKRYSKLNEINIWHVGCSSGLEVYSMLMLLDKINLFEQANIFGTDINEDMLNLAQHGKYRYIDIQDFFPNFDKVLNPYESSASQHINMDKYFKTNDQHDYVQMLPFLTDKPIFLKHNIISCKNFLKKQFDIILCRNVLIYFDTELQNKIIHFFYENLADGGLLILGKQEGIYGNYATGFSKVDNMYIKHETKR